MADVTTIPIRDVMAKTCPFCENTKHIVEAKKGKYGRLVDGVMQDTYSVAVRCLKCNAKGPSANVTVNGWMRNRDAVLAEKAVAKWNGRRCDGSNT